MGGVPGSPAPPLALPQPYDIAFHGTSRVDKEWPEQHWVAFAHAMQRHQLQVLLPWGSEAEKARAHRIAAAADNTVVLPQLTLTQIATLIRDARGVIGMDTGLIHAAAALQRPVLALYPATRPELTGALPQQGGAEVVNLAEGRSAGGPVGLPLRQCPKCGATSLIHQEGCDLCTSCGYSKCS